MNRLRQKRQRIIKLPLMGGIMVLLSLLALPGGALAQSCPPPPEATGTSCSTIGEFIYNTSSNVYQLCVEFDSGPEWVTYAGPSVQPDCCEVRDIITGICYDYYPEGEIVTIPASCPPPPEAIDPCSPSDIGDVDYDGSINSIKKCINFPGSGTWWVVYRGPPVQSNCCILDPVTGVCTGFYYPEGDVVTIDPGPPPVQAYCDGSQMISFPAVDTSCPPGGTQAYCNGTEMITLPEIDYSCPGSAATSCAEESGTHAFDQQCHVDALVQAWNDHWKQVWQPMAEQFAVTMMHQVFIIGQFFDAKHQLETQLLMQELAARAHKRYHPDTGICRIGTNMRSLVPAEIIYRTNAYLLNEMLLRRETLSAGVSAAAGYPNDLENRLENFKTTYCDPNENNGAITAICTSTPAPTPDRLNKDINYMKTIAGKYTLDIDFTDTNLTPDEEDVLALLANIISHRTFTRVPEEHLTQSFAKDELQDMRSVHAIRGLVRNSFAHITGMRAKSRGTGPGGAPEVEPYMYKILEQLQVPPAEIEEFLGENPSYFAQMEVLTRRIYQDPEFYTNLYTKPANVQRMGVALQAIKLMQDRDRYEAALRREMLVSMILELQLREHQQTVTNNLLSGIAVIFSDPPY